MYSSKLVHYVQWLDAQTEKWYCSFYKADKLMGNIEGYDNINMAMIILKDLGFTLIVK